MSAISKADGKPFQSLQLPQNSRKGTQNIRQNQSSSLVASYTHTRILWYSSQFTKGSANQKPKPLSQTIIWMLGQKPYTQTACKKRTSRRLKGKNPKKGSQKGYIFPSSNAQKRLLGLAPHLSGLLLWAVDLILQHHQILKPQTNGMGPGVSTTSAGGRGRWTVKKGRNKTYQEL